LLVFSPISGVRRRTTKAREFNEINEHLDEDHQITTKVIYPLDDHYAVVPPDGRVTSPPTRCGAFVKYKSSLGFEVAVMRKRWLVFSTNEDVDNSVDLEEKIPFLFRDLYRQPRPEDRKKTAWEITIKDVRALVRGALRRTYGNTSGLVNPAQLQAVTRAEKELRIQEWDNRRVLELMQCTLPGC